MTQEVFDIFVDEIIPQALFHVKTTDIDKETGARLDEIMLLEILYKHPNLLSVKPFSWFISHFIEGEKKIKIELNDYSWECGDGCCTDYGTNVYVNGVEMPYKNNDTGTIIQQILEHLGYDVELIETYNGEI